jgi:hypothetical protein
MAVKEFKNDKEYHAWIVLNQSCFVVNTPKGINSQKFVLHTTICPHIKSYVGFDPDVFTARNHDKFGAKSINELKQFFEDKGYSKFKGEFELCKTCNPHQ